MMTDREALQLAVVAKALVNRVPRAASRSSDGVRMTAPIVIRRKGVGQSIQESFSPILQQLQFNRVRAQQREQLDMAGLAGLTGAAAVAYGCVRCEDRGIPERAAGPGVLILSTRFVAPSWC